MANITLRQLKYFEALAEHGHFGRAAEACAVSQPALSVQIKELEESLGLALFERGPREVRLTGFGEEFLTRARDILQGTDELLDLARASKDRLAGRLRIGTAAGVVHASFTLHPDGTVDTVSLHRAARRIANAELYVAGISSALAGAP